MIGRSINECTTNGDFGEGKNKYNSVQSTDPMLNYDDSSNKCGPSRLLIDQSNNNPTLNFSQLIFPKNEMARVHTLHASMLLKDQKLEDDLLVYTSMAARMFKTPLATINFIDSHYVHFASIVGTRKDVASVDRSLSLCSYTISDEAPTVSVFPNAREAMGMIECKFDNRPVEFYAGSPIFFLGYKIGSICVLDDEPRSDFDDRKKFMMLDLAAIVSRYLEERQRQSLRSEVAYAQLMVSILQSLKPSLTRAMRQKRAVEFVFDVLKYQSTPTTIKGYVLEFSDAIKEFQNGLNQLASTIETSLSLGLMSIQLKPSIVRKRSLSFNPINGSENGLIKWIQELYDHHTMPPYYSSSTQNIHWCIKPTAARSLHVTDLSMEACSLVSNLLINRNLLAYNTIFVIVDMIHINNNIDHSDTFSNIRSSKIMIHIVCSDPIKFQIDNEERTQSPELTVSPRYTSQNHCSELLLSADEQARISSMRFIQQCDLFVARSLVQSHRGGIEHFLKHGPVDEEYPFLEPKIVSEWFKIWLPCKSICANDPVLTPISAVNNIVSSSAMSPSLSNRYSAIKSLQNVVDINGLLDDLS